MENQPAAQQFNIHPGEKIRVAVTDIDMPFGSMILFMIKWALASIPAFLILLFIMGSIVAVLAAVFGGLGALMR